MPSDAVKPRPEVVKKSTEAIERKWAQEIDNLNPDPNPFNVPDTADEFIRQCRIRTGAGFQLFDLYDYQIELLKLVLMHPMIMIIKDRQLGITELLAAIAYYLCLTDPAYSAAFVSINQDKAAEISQRIDGMAPAEWAIKWRTNNGSTLRPDGCGVMRFLPSTKNAARGFPSVNWLAYDEAGFLQYFNELYGNGTSAQESVPPDRRKIILNTTIPEEGAGHPVWGMFADANDGPVLSYIRSARVGGTNCGIPGMIHWIDQNGCCKVIIGHKVHPIYGQDPDYIQSVCKRRKIPLAIALREHNLGIEAAGSSLFSEVSIELQGCGAWAEPQEGHKYVAMTDPNFGGSDNYVTLILDITEPTASLVAEYADSNRSVEYSEGKSLELCDKYNVVAAAVESNSGGKIVVEDYQRLRPNLNVLLCNTTNSSKRTNTDRVAFAVEQGSLIYPPDWQGADEMRSFSAMHREATAGSKDDRVMALAAGYSYMIEARKLRPATVGKGLVRR
jgi:hypothetical protein